MESSSLILKASNTKRFVVEDSVTKVTSDGEPHEMMTMIAGLSGLLAAIVILTILIFLVACKKSKNQHECDKCSEVGSAAATTTGAGDESQSKCPSSIIAYNPKQLDARSISVICAGNNDSDFASYKGNFQSNINKAFESSELDLQSALKSPKQKKKTHWQDEMELQRGIAIQVERY